MAKISASKAVKKEFTDRVKPIMESWGLSRHPSPMSSFGGDELGYRYDFADLNNPNDVKVALFYIMGSKPSLWIAGLHTKNKFGGVSDIPIIFGNTEGVFRLNKTPFILTPYSVKFEFRKGINETNEQAAARLIDSVLKNIHKLKDFLYK